ncbi:MAG: hypothetical protein AB8G26_17530 [Ilumatobacter sp.]
MARNKRTHDIVLFGATSFVGQILTRYLQERHGSDGDLKWAMAGRNADKLAAVAAETGAHDERGVLGADDPAPPAELCAHTNRAIPTVRP